MSQFLSLTIFFTWHIIKRGMSMQQQFRQYIGNNEDCMKLCRISEAETWRFAWPISLFFLKSNVEYTLGWIIYFETFPFRDLSLSLGLPVPYSKHFYSVFMSKSAHACKQAFYLSFHTQMTLDGIDMDFYWKMPVSSKCRWKSTLVYRNLYSVNVHICMYLWVCNRFVQSIVPVIFPRSPSGNLFPSRVSRRSVRNWISPTDTIENETHVLCIWLNLENHYAGFRNFW